MLAVRMRGCGAYSCTSCASSFDARFMRAQLTALHGDSGEVAAIMRIVKCDKSLMPHHPAMFPAESRADHPDSGMICRYD